MLPFYIQELLHSKDTDMQTADAARGILLLLDVLDDIAAVKAMKVSTTDVMDVSSALITTQTGQRSQQVGERV